MIQCWIESYITCYIYYHVRRTGRLEILIVISEIISLYLYFSSFHSYVTGIVLYDNILYYLLPEQQINKTYQTLH